MAAYSTYPPAHYDTNGRLIRKVFPDGSEVQYMTDKPGVSVVVDANLASSNNPGSATITQYDAIGRKVRVETCSDIPDGPTYSQCPNSSSVARTYYAYDALDRLTTIEQALVATAPDSPSNRAQVSENFYDGLGKVYRTDNYDAGLDNEEFGTYTTIYDLAGNPTVIQKPSGIQTVNRYDAAGRIIKTSTKVGGRETNGAKYKYGRSPSPYYNLGRLRSVRTVSRDPAGNRSIVTKAYQYSAHGQVASEATTVASELYGASSVKMSYVYDSVGRLVDTIYPAVSSADNLDRSVSQTVRTQWNQYGQPISLSTVASNNFAASTIVASAKYDVYGHLVDLRHGNGVRDFARYYGLEENLKLQCIRTRKTDGGDPGCFDQFNASAGDRQALLFQWDSKGQVTTIEDLNPGAANSSNANLNNQTISYDAMGRMETVAYNGTLSETYEYGDLGNIEYRHATDNLDTRDYTYGATHPHRLKFYGNDELTYDRDGNRKTRAREGLLDYFEYDGLGRLVRTTANGTLLEDSVYDEGTHRVVRYNPSEDPVRIFHESGLVELERDAGGSTLQRYFTFAGRLVATDTTDTSAANNYWTTPPVSSILLTTAARHHDEGRIVRVRHGRAQLAATHGALVLLVLLAGCVCWLIWTVPSGWSRAGVAVAAVAIFNLVPLPGMLTAGGQFGLKLASASTGLPYRAYFHVDQLGSVQVVTDGSGAAVGQVRYRGFGQVRCADTDCRGSSATSPDPLLSKTYTGHERDSASGLLYMGARHYDPDLGLFLTFDPAGNGPSPYIYASNNPFAAIDPDGRDPISLTTVAIIAALSAAVSFIDTIIATGNVGAAFKNAALAAVSAAVLAPAGQVLIGALTGVTQQVARAVAIAYSAYSAEESIRGGSALAAAFAIYSIALGLASMAAAPSGSKSGGAAGGGYQSRGLHQQEISEYSGMFKPRTISWSDVRLDNQVGADGRAFTWKWPWSTKISIHLGGDYSPYPILGAGRAAALLAHELAHAFDFTSDWLGTVLGAGADQAKYKAGIDVYNPSLNSPLSVEGRATAYEWAYRLRYGSRPSPLPSNYPTDQAGQNSLYRALYQ